MRIVCLEVYHSINNSEITVIRGYVGGCHNKNVLSDSNSIHFDETYVKAEDVFSYIFPLHNLEIVTG